MMYTLDEGVNGATPTPTSPTLKRNTWLGPEQKLSRHISPTYSIDRTCSWKFPASEEKSLDASAILFYAMAISLQPWQTIMITGIESPEGY